MIEVVAGFCLGFICGCCWCAAVVARREAGRLARAVRDARESMAGDSNGPYAEGWRRHWKADDAVPPTIAASDEWTALRAQFPYLSAAQLAAILERRYQERRRQ